MYTLHTLGFLQFKRHSWGEQEGLRVRVSDNHTAEVRAAVISSESLTRISEKRVAYRYTCVVSVRQGFRAPWAGSSQGCYKLHWDGYWFPPAFQASTCLRVVASTVSAVVFILPRMRWCLGNTEIKCSMANIETINWPIPAAICGPKILASAFTSCFLQLGEGLVYTCSSIKSLLLTKSTLSF